MKTKNITVVLLALVLLNILDGSFTSPTILDWVKLPLFILCFALLFKAEGRDNNAA